jgi:hypothetical protein
MHIAGAGDQYILLLGTSHQAGQCMKGWVQTYISRLDRICCCSLPSLDGKVGPGILFATIVHQWILVSAFILDARTPTSFSDGRLFCPSAIASAARASAS